MILLIIALLISLSPNQLNAEPWMSNRFAQNCAACHSPGRINLQAKDRRCSLSCQGCHVNPSGGGLRNEYGVWNQQRWFRSFSSNFFENRGLPAPFAVQKYSIKTKKKNNEVPKDGYPLQVYKTEDYKESDYDRSDNQEHITAKTRDEFLERLTDDDPYRSERKNWIFAGGNLRFLSLNQKTQPAGTASTDYGYLLPMSFDLGVRLKPTKKKNIQFVFEHRYYNYPIPSDVNKTELEWVSASDGSRMRSAYVLVDDLAYNSYIQYGVYRPLFGINTPDHTGLAQNIMYNTSSGQGVDNIGFESALHVNKTLSFGLSPNVPFANVHWITPVANSNYPQDKGFAVNLGGRFVTYGLSAMLSYWNTKAFIAGSDIKKTAISLNFGGMYKNLIANLDFMQIEKDAVGGGSDKGHVQSLDIKYRMWREVYLVFNHARSNTTRTLKEGSAMETMMGVKSILIPGLEFEVLDVTRQDQSNASGRWDRKQLQAMVNVFF